MANPSLKNRYRTEEPAMGFRRFNFVRRLLVRMVEICRVYDQPL